jgi:hypothetical protein
MRQVRPYLYSEGKIVTTLSPQPRYLSISYEYESTVVGLGGVGFEVLGLGFRFRWDLGFRALGQRLRDWGLGFRV